MNYLHNAILAMSAVTLVSLTSCMKEKGSGQEGSAVRFDVSTLIDGDRSTRTVYSGKDENNAGISAASVAERINWLSTDRIRIASAQAYRPDGSGPFADYLIAPEDIEGAAHKAGITPVGEQMKWGTGSHDFYALYPSPLQNGNADISVDGTGATVTGSIPADQDVTLSGHAFKPDMDYAYMYALKTGVGVGSKVELAFKPLVTTLELSLLTPEGDEITSRLTSVTLSSTQSDAFLAGDFTATLTPGGLTPLIASDVSNGRNEITLDLGEGVLLSTTDAYTFTFLMVPMDQSELKLTLRFADTSKRTLRLKYDGEWITLAACKKTYIRNLGAPKTVDQYVFTETDPDDLVYPGGTTTAGNVVSYRYSRSEDIPANRTIVPWDVEGYYPTAEDAAAGTNKYAGISDTYLTGFTAEMTGSEDGETVTIDYGGNGTSTRINYIPEVIARLKSNEGAYVERGTASSPWNLANPLTGSTAAIAETANSYIVNAPGYYCFPLVMGNGIKNGSLNPVAWQQTYFKNYKGDPLSGIDSPLLNDQGGTPTGAYVIWETRKVVSVNDETDWVLPSAITSSTMTIGGESRTVYWLNFRIVAPDDYSPCNAHLAVTDENGEVMWSWLIWVTDYVPANYGTYDPDADAPDMLDVECTDVNGAKTTFMARNLGWLFTGTRVETNYAEACVYVRLHQEDSDNYIVMRVAKPQGDGVELQRGGSGPYYQWGRKDPLMQINSVQGGRVRSFLFTGEQQALEVTIRNPDRMYGNGSVTSNHDWCTQTSVRGWWCAGNTVNNVDKVTVKTIYDPSPAGYTIPRRNAFTVFRLGTSGTAPNKDGAFSGGFNFWNGYRADAEASTEGMKTIFFPVGGYRSNTNGGKNLSSTSGFMWSAVPQDAHDGYSLSISASTANPFRTSYRCYGNNIRPSREE